MPPSPIILASPIMLFLGAGASAPLGKPLMDGFVAKLPKQIHDNDQKSLLQLLTKFRGPDLESIMSELDTIIGLNYATSVDGNHLVSYQGPTGTEEKSVFFSLKRNTALYLFSNVKHAIMKEYREVNAAKAVELYEPVLDLLFSRLDTSKHCLTIFTTNYDPAIEVFCRQKSHTYHLWDGFVYDNAYRHNHWQRSVFDDLELANGKRNIVLFKLHGSTDWIHNKSTGRIEHGHAMYDAMDSDAYSNVLIYPATQKIAIDEPYYSGYEYYQRCCERAEVCLAVGYSFRDYDALTRLRGASSVNEKFTLGLLSPDAEAVLTTVPLPASQKVAYPMYFGKDSEQYILQLKAFLMQVI